MANQFFCGNEKGDYRGDGLLEVGFSVLPVINQKGGRSTILGHGGQFYYYVGPNIGTPNNAQLQKSLSGPLGELFGQFAFLMSTGASGTTDMFYFFLGSVLIGKISAINQGGQLVKIAFFRGDGTQIGASSPDSFGLVTTAWTLVEFHVKPAASGGIIEIWVNGTLEIQVLNGNITGPGGEVTMDTVRFGTSNGVNVQFDDIMVNDTTGTVNNARPNGVYVLSQYAIGAGNFSQLVNSFGNSIGNYQFINNVPFNAPNIGYVGTNTPGQKDTYLMAPPPLEFVGFPAIKASILAAKNGPGITHAQAVIIPNAEAEIDVPGAPGQNIPNGGFGWMEFVQELNVNTGLPYTAAEIANLQVGAKFNA
jgi:hypothetical protein